MTSFKILNRRSLIAGFLILGIIQPVFSQAGNFPTEEREVLLENRLKRKPVWVVKYVNSKGIVKTKTIESKPAPWSEKVSITVKKGSYHAVKAKYTNQPDSRIIGVCENLKGDSEIIAAVSQIGRGRPKIELTCMKLITIEFSVRQKYWFNNPVEFIVKSLDGKLIEKVPVFSLESVTRKYKDELYITAISNQPQINIEGEVLVKSNMGIFVTIENGKIKLFQEPIEDLGTGKQ